MFECEANTVYARVRSKICGIGNLDDALWAVRCGADALGFVFYQPSPRYINIETAASICAELPPFVEKVGLFVDHSEEEIRKVLESVPLSLLQFHGNEVERDCLKYDLPYMKAIRVRSDQDWDNAEAAFPSAQALLADTYRAGVPGGTGEVFDWNLLPANRTKPLVLAGGLTAENVRNAIQAVEPYAVDVSGGVERSKGFKDEKKVEDFIKEVCRER